MHGTPAEAILQELVRASTVLMLPTGVPQVYDESMLWPRVLMLSSVLTLAACSTVPVGPTVMVLPGAGKALEQFQLDDAACRQWATQQMGTGGDAWMMQRRYDIAYQQCMYSRGNMIPGASPPPGGSAPPPPPPPPPGR